MRDYSDQELWSLSREGNGDAFAELFTRHAKPVYNYLFRRCASWETAEDLTSIVFLEAWRKRRDVLLDRESALPWLLGVATNVLRNQRRAEFRYRKALQRFPAPEDEADFSEDVAARLSDEKQMRRLLAVFGQIPRKEQDVIALCLWSGLTYEEAAAALRLPIGTVRSRLSRGRTRLRELLEASGHVPGDCMNRHAKEGLVP